jgi:drug/metabolite transporter (DMT)-like permease
MFAAVLTTLLFSLSAICGRRVTHFLDGTHANLARLCFAALVLGLGSRIFGFEASGRAFPMLFLSGCVGFGMGDLAMFKAYRHIGVRRTVVIMQCLAAPFGAVGEWLWLGQAPTLAQAAYGFVTLAGVGIALTPATAESPTNRGAGIGIWFGTLAAIGQAAGAVLSRKAYEMATMAGETFHPTVAGGVSAAFQRVLGGIVVSICLFVYLKTVRRPAEPALTDWKKGWPWVLGHSLAGPAAGVTCFQWALMLEPANIVLPIIATTPLAVLPLAHFFEGEHVTRRAIIGGAVAVAGVIGLVRAR